MGCFFMINSVFKLFAPVVCLTKELLLNFIFIKMKTRLNRIINGSILSLVVASLLLFSGCLKSAEDPQTPQQYLNEVLASINKTQLAADLAIIDDSLEVFGFTPDILIEPNGVRYKIETAGPAEGLKPTLNNIIKIKYTGKLLSTGETFDTSENLPAKYLETFLYGLITGFQTTMPLLVKGTKATLYIPSGYGYGATDVRNQAGAIIIPKNSNLIFEVELLDVR